METINSPIDITKASNKTEKASEIEPQGTIKDKKKASEKQLTHMKKMSEMKKIKAEARKMMSIVETHHVNVCQTPKQISRPPVMRQVQPMEIARTASNGPYSMPPLFLMCAVGILGVSGMCYFVMQNSTQTPTQTHTYQQAPKVTKQETIKEQAPPSYSSLQLDF
jgi:hypothetical protein